MKKNRLLSFILLVLWFSLLSAEAASVTVSVPGTSNPWLAGLPDGATTGGGEDIAPAQSPVLVVGISLAPGTELSFSADGGVGNDNQSPLRFPPDGEHVVGHDPGAENGISTATAPIDCLMGVFLGPDRPDVTQAPPPLDFSSAASRDFESLRPLLKQVFFIGDGRTSTGSVQRILPPPGATRLFLGTMDGGGWYNNAGSFSVTITEAPSTEAIVYDVSHDFSIVGNPNGVWSYGWKTSIGGEFVPFLHSQESVFGNGVPYQVWDFGLAQLPGVACNTSTNTGIGDGDYPPGTVWFVGGSDGSPQNFCVVRFTVPSQQGGSYRLESAVRSQLDGERSQDADYHVVVNGVEVFGQFLLPNSATGYTNIFVLAAGSTIDFLAGRGADGIAYGSALKIHATLSHQIPCTPHKAKATAQVVNGFVVGATITDSGCGYTNAPLVLIQGGGGSGATAMAEITDGRVVRIIITDAGIGYEGTPRIVIASPPFVSSLTIAVSRVKVVQNVALGRHYVLESSNDARSWSEALPPFTATSESITNEFDVEMTGRFFRVRETP